MQANARRTTQFDRIRKEVRERGLVGEELTAREIQDAVGEEAGLSSPHEAATVLGLHRDEPRFSVVRESPYRYVFR